MASHTPVRNNLSYYNKSRHSLETGLELTHLLSDSEPKSSRDTFINLSSFNPLEITPT